MAISEVTGICQYLKYGPSSANTAIGRVTGGSMGSRSNLTWQSNIGGKHALLRGMAEIGGTATIEVVDATFLAYALRASTSLPALTALYIEGGDSTRSFTQSGCAINSMEFSLSVGSPLTMTVEWFALDQALNSSPALPATSSTIWQWAQGACTFNGSQYAMQSMTVRVNNNLTRASSLDSHSADTLYIPEDLFIGNEQVSASMTFLEYPGSALTFLHEDTAVSGLAAVMSCVQASPSSSFTVTLANLAGEAVSMPFVGDGGVVTWSFEGSCQPNEANSIAVAFA